MGRKVGAGFAVLVIATVLLSIAYGIALDAAPVSVARILSLRGRFDGAYAIDSRRSLALLEHIGGRGKRDIDVSRLVVIDLAKGTETHKELPWERWMGRSGDVIFGRDQNLIARSLSTGAAQFELTEHLLAGKDNFALGVDGRLAYRTDDDQPKVVDVNGKVELMPAGFETVQHEHRFLTLLEEPPLPSTLVRPSWIADSDDGTRIAAARGFLALHYAKVDAQRAGIGAMVSAVNDSGEPSWHFTEPGEGRRLLAAFRAHNDAVLVFADLDDEHVTVRCLALTTGEQRWVVER